MTGLPRLLADRRRRLLLGLLVANGVAQGATLVATAFVVQHAFDSLVARRAADPQSLAVQAAILLGAAALAGWLRSRERIEVERLGQSYVHDARLAMYERLSVLSPRALGRRSRGGVGLRFIGDLTALRTWVSLGLSRLLVSATFITVTVGALAAVSVTLALAVGLAVVIGAAGVMGLGRPLARVSRRARRRRARLAANLNEQIAAQPVVQVFGQGRRERRRVRRQSRRLGRAMVDRARAIGHMRGVTEATAGAATAVVAMAGGLEVTSGRASVGTAVAALAIVGLLVSPLRDLGRVPEYWHASRVSLEKLRDFVAMPGAVEDRPGAPPLAEGAGRLDFEEVALEGALHGITATAEPGGVVAVVGPNGAGKSSLLLLAARLEDPDAGVVRIDGEDLRDRSLGSVRDAVGIAGPDLPLLRGSVERNLRYRRPEAAPEELERVIELCGLEPLLQRLPEGLRSRVGEGGQRLSAGERQRVALARAVLGRPRLLLLDEADANLDGIARATLKRVVAAIRGKMTVLVVTHRSELAEGADVIWRLDDGRLVEQGTPGELVSGDSATARLLAPPPGARVARLAAAGSGRGPAGREAV